MGSRTITIQSALKPLRTFIEQRFNLSEGKASEKQTTEEIRQNVVFKGANLWILIFAILVASVGLDVNSTAVIIGAMLISPLMGPIMGVGLGVGIHDFELIIKSLKNLGIAAIISVFASSIYFLISPFDQAQSELLARTSPDLRDVLIACFGGFAGIIAGSRSEKSNAIPGVAIATALMPPLCTAGFALATFQWQYFLGATFLFFINCVFISISTYIIVRALKFKPKIFIDPQREKKVNRYITVLVIATIIPSVYTAYYVWLESRFKNYANEFIEKEFVFANTQVINNKPQYDKHGSIIDVILLGEVIPDDVIAQVQSKMPLYKLDKCKLNVHQGPSDKGPDMATLELLHQQLKNGIIEDLYQKNEEQIKTRDDRIKLLESEIVKYQAQEIPINELVNEIKVINNNVSQISIAPAILSDIDSSFTDSLFLAYLKFRKRPDQAEVNKVEAWLKVRMKSEKIRMIYQIY